MSTLPCFFVNNIGYFFVYVMFTELDWERTCDQCLRKYKNKGALKHHKRYECGKEKEINCPHCSYK